LNYTRTDIQFCAATVRK